MKIEEQDQTNDIRFLFWRKHWHYTSWLFGVRKVTFWLQEWWIISMNIFKWPRIWFLSWNISFFQSLSDKLKEISEEESLHSSRRWDDLSNWICWKAVSYTNNKPKMEKKYMDHIGRWTASTDEFSELWNIQLKLNLKLIAWRTSFRNVISINKMT